MALFYTMANFAYTLDGITNHSIQFPLYIHMVPMVLYKSSIFYSSMAGSCDITHLIILDIAHLKVLKII